MGLGEQQPRSWAQHETRSSEQMVSGRARGQLGCLDITGQGWGRLKETLKVPSLFIMTRLLRLSPRVDLWGAGASNQRPASSSIMDTMPAQRTGGKVDGPHGRLSWAWPCSPFLLHFLNGPCSPPGPILLTRSALPSPGGPGVTQAPFLAPVCSRGEAWQARGLRAERRGTVLPGRARPVPLASEPPEASLAGPSSPGPPLSSPVTCSGGAGFRLAVGSRPPVFTLFSARCSREASSPKLL